MRVPIYVAGVLLIAAAVLGPMLKNRYDADSGPAELRGAHLLALEDHRHAIVIVCEASHGYASLRCST